MIKPQNIMDLCMAIIAQRDESYGEVEVSFQRIAKLATLRTGKNITVDDVCVIMESVKDARLMQDADHEDSHLDKINYALFRAMFSMNKKVE